MTQGLLRIYVEDKDGNVVSFPLNEEQAVVKDWTRTAERMAGAPSVTGTVMHRLCLDNLWTRNEFVVIDGERYYVKQVPTSSKDTDDVRYKHELTLVSERDILENVYFFDCVSSDEESQTADKPRTNTTDFSFFGDINELVGRLNDSLSYSKIYDKEGKTGFCIVIDEDVEIGEAKEVTVTDAYFATAMQEIYNVFNVPYYWIGKICHVGYAQSEITTPFEYGRDNGLLSVSRNNSEYRIINRITGTGSSDNLPYYYPNTDPNGRPILSYKKMSEGNINSLELSVLSSKFDGILGKTFYVAEMKESDATVPYQFQSLSKNNFFSRDVTFIVPYRQGTDPDEKKVYSKNDAFEGILSYSYEIGHLYHDQVLDFSNVVMDSNFCYCPKEWEYPRSKYSFIKHEVDVEYYFNVANLSKVGADGKLHKEKVNMNDPRFRVVTEGDYRIEFVCKYKNLRYYFDIYFAGGLPCHDAGRKISALAKSPGDTYSVQFGYYVAGHIETTMPFGKYILCNDTLVEYEKSGVVLNNMESLDIVGLKYENNLEGVNEYKLVYDIDYTSNSYSCFTVDDVKFTNPMTKLMPSIYRTTEGAERFFNAKNNVTDPSVKDAYINENGEEYVFDNVYSDTEPYEGIQNFDDIKPTINGIANPLGQMFGEIADVSFDDTDSDDMQLGSSDSSNATPVHPYFYVKLHRFNGEFGFNLFKQGLSKGAMTFNFITGSCAGCSFEVAVCSAKQVGNHYEFKNPVQVDEYGNIVGGDTSSKVNTTKPMDSQQDTSQGEVWVALKKENSTFGILMPNATNNYRPKAGDKFVITNILLPQVYITAAEKRLDKALVKYMSENNDEKFTFSIKFSRIYLQKHIGDIVPHLNENARINVKYNNTIYPLYVSSYTQKYDGNILDEISVELSEELTITQNKTKQQMNSILGNVNEQINSALKDNSNNSQQEVTDGDLVAIKNLLNNKLSKVNDDTAAGLITFLRGLKSIGEIFSEGKITAKGGAVFGEFIDGLLGQGGRITADGIGTLRSLRLFEWLEVPEIRYNRITVNVGLSINSEGGGVIEKVIVDTDDDGNNLSTGSAYLKLEDGEYGAIVEEDLCMGLWHDFGGGNATETTDDRHGNIQIRGFKTIYFRITSVPEQDPEGYDNSDNHFFTYTLRSSLSGGNGIHPVAMLHFAQRGNPNDKGRQNIEYKSTAYTINLHDVTDWNFSPSWIYYIKGHLDNFTMQQVGDDGQTYTKTFKGTGVVMANAYIYGEIDKFERVGYRMAIDQSLGGTIAPSETETITCMVYDGYGQDKTYLFTKWAVTRDSGDEASDILWNAEHGNITNTFELSFSDLGLTGLDNRLSTMFRVTARTEDEKAAATQTLAFN